MTAKAKNFAIIGASGYIAPRHMKAIKDTGNRLVAALDPNDSVGVIDSYFPECNFFTEFERFDRHIDKIRRKVSLDTINFVTICSPNYLHDAHTRFAFRSGADAICEKPLALNPWNLDGLQEIEEATGRKVFNILQLRLHPSLVQLKERITNEKLESKYEVDLTYVTSRGKWYMASWKGVDEKSGGIATNIGVHFFDMLGWLFGKLQTNEVHLYTPYKASGYLEYESARVRWFLSIDKNDILNDSKALSKTTHRSITVNGVEVEFSGGFSDLHTTSYEKILSGQGFGINECRTAIGTVHDIRNNAITSNPSSLHPFLLQKK